MAYRLRFVTLKFKIPSMNKLILLAALSLGTAGMATAQKSQYSGPLPRVIIKFSPQHMFVNTLHGSVELFNDDMRMSHNLSLLVRYKPSDPADYYATRSSGAAIEYMAKFYPNKFKVVKKLGSEKPMGMYGGMFVQAGSFKDKGVVQIYDPKTFQYTDQDVQVSHTPFYFGFAMGRQLMVNDFMYVDMHVGAGLRVSNSSSDTYEELPSGRKQYKYLETTSFPMHGFSGILPRVGFTVGIGLD